MSSPRETLSLLGIGLENLAHNARLGCRELALLGRHGWWWRWRSALGLAYLTRPAFRIVRREGPSTGLEEEDLIYGETPPTTAWELLSQLRLTPDDHVVDLGCGRGTILFLAALGFGASGTGMDAIGAFVERGRAVARSLGLTSLEFLRGDFRVDPLPPGGIYFLSPTTLTEESWAALKDRLLETDPGTRAVSLTRPLPALGWATVDRRPRDTTWGKATVYIQRRL